MNVMLLLSIILVIDIALTFASLLNGNDVFSNGILKIMTINALFLIQISFNINYFLRVIYNLYKKNIISNDDTKNIISINILSSLIIIIIEIIQFVKYNKLNNLILMSTVWTSILSVLSKNIIDWHINNLKINDNLKMINLLIEVTDKINLNNQNQQHCNLEINV